MTTQEKIAEALTAAERALTLRLGSTAALAWKATTKTDTNEIATVAARHSERLAEWPAFVRETFGDFFSSKGCRALPEAQRNEWASKAHAALRLTSTYGELAEAAGSHRALAALAASRLSDEVARTMGLDRLPEGGEAAQAPADLSGAAERLRALLDDESTPPEEIESIEKDLAEIETAEKLAEGRRASTLAKLAQASNSGALAKAVASVSAEVAQDAEVVGVLRGFGLGGGPPGGTEEIEPDLIRFVRDNPMVREILDLAGRMLEDARATQKKTGEARTNVVGVGVGSNPLRLTIGGLRRLASPETYELACYELASGIAPQKLLEDESPSGRGDFVVMVDRSGSMTGERIRFARALGAAATLAAHREGRRVVVVSFSDDATAVVVEEDGKGMAAAIRLLALGAEAGTNVEAALEAATKAAGALRSPDLLLVTDGHFPALPSSSLAKAKGDEERRLIAVTIGGGGDVEGFDETHKLSGRGDLNLASAAKILGGFAPGGAA